MTEESSTLDVQPFARLTQVREALDRGDAPPRITVRSFLGWFFAMRRGHWIVHDIRMQLERAGIVTVPDFESAYIDSEITFAIASAPAPAGEESSGNATVVADAVLVTEPEPGIVSIGIGDPTYRLTKLAAANRAPLWVAPDRPLTDAVTLMLANDYSQLPVMTNERTVKGIISWKSIGARWALERGGDAVRDFMDDAFEIGADRSLFSALPTIVDQGYVLVRDSANRVAGIVTTSDLSAQFQQLAEPFLLLGEIENHVRRLIDGRFTKEELGEAKDPADVSREIANVVNLTFGEYIRLLQDPGKWAKLGITLERTIFLKELDAVRKVRNEVMHFDPDPLPAENLATLRRFARFLQTLQTYGI